MNDEKLFEDDPEDKREKPRIKVTDRRQFDREGNPKATAAAAPEGTGEAEEPPPTDEATEQTATARAAAPDPVDTRGEDAAQDAAEDNNTAAKTEHAAQSEDDRSRNATPTPGIADLPRDFSAFVEGMYLEAMLYLGAIPNPHTGEVVEDIELAKYKIDLLGMLGEKTEGNLTADEKRQVDEVLYQLRMVYLQKTKTVDP